MKENISVKKDLHREIVKNIVKLIDELKLDNVHEKFYAFCYLLWNGYFSVNKTYGYSDCVEDEKNTIFTGMGCCRHNANLMNEVFIKLGIFCPTVDLKVISVGTRNSGIKREIIKRTDDPIDYSDEPNHRACLIKKCTNNMIVSPILLDPTFILECQVFDRGKIYCPRGKYIINANQFSSAIKEKIDFHGKYNPNPIISREETEKFYGYVKDVLLYNNNLLEDFFNDNYKLYKKINLLIKKHM